MEYLKVIQAAGISLGFLILIFIPMEKVFPANPNQKIFRPRWLTDFCFFLGQHLFWSWVLLWSLHHFEAVLNGFMSENLRVTIQSQPWILQAFEALLLSDILIYWGHRLQHKVDFLWRFHKVHHSPVHLDWLAAYREHPMDSLYSIIIINLPAFIMGFPLESVAAVIAFRAIWAVFIHSNIRFSLGPIRNLIGAPELHHWHHDLDRDAGNYANISPLMDLIFGTHVCPNREPEKFGIKEKTSSNYFGQMLEPLFPKFIWDKFKRIQLERVFSMKLFLMILFLVFTSGYSYEETTAGLNRSTCGQMKKSKSDLHDVSMEIMEMYKQDSLFLNQFAKNDSIWQLYLKSKFDMKYPNRETPGYYGSSFSMCSCIFFNDQYNKRLQELEEWRKGDEEGDMCRGSVLQK